ncbi:MAG TPA: hypothetical protein VK660_03590 [Xanthomonadaceae bacterium]|nr:hypothetical protein [Xanthomonadaceae bacterium]
MRPTIDALDAYMKHVAKIAAPSRADVLGNARIIAPPPSPPAL